jgi:hypothetical protein
MIVGHQSAILYHQLEIDGAHGVVAKWQGKGLQNPHHGFKSRRRLKKSGPFSPLFHYYAAFQVISRPILKNPRRICFKAELSKL